MLRNAGDRTGEIADHFRRAEVLDRAGNVQVRERSDLHFGDHTSDLDDPVVLSVEFELPEDRPDALVKRMRKAWIARKATTPAGDPPAVRVFANPHGFLAATLIEKAGLARFKVGLAEVSERNANYVAARPGATAADVLQLVTALRDRVRDALGVQLEQELKVW